MCWKSKAQSSVALSSTEAEWIVLSEATKEIIFVLQLLESLGIKVNLPITVLVDNTGAIFVSKTSIRQVAQNTLTCALNAPTNTVKMMWSRSFSLN